MADPKRRLTPKEWAKAESLYESGEFNLEQIAAEFGEQLARQRGVPLVVFTYSLSEDFFTRNLYPRVARVGAEEGFPVIDVRTRARLTEPVEGYVNIAADLHPNAKGHAVIADVMHEVLRDRAAATGVK